MLNKEYEIKADITSAKENKYNIALHPAGHQYKINDLKNLLRVNGFKTIKEAKEAGWRFK